MLLIYLIVQLKGMDGTTVLALGLLKVVTNTLVSGRMTNFTDKPPSPTQMETNTLESSRITNLMDKEHILVMAKYM